MSDDAEIIKAVAEGTMSGVMAPFNDLIGRLFQPVVTEIGQDLRERYISFRRSRAERLLGRTKQIIEESKIDPQPVPPKLLASILENGSLEDDDYLQDRWARLLASSAMRPNKRGELLTSAVDILKQLNKWEAMLLTKCMGTMTMEEIAPLPNPGRKSQTDTIREWQIDLRHNNGFDRSGMEYSADFALMLENLIRLGLLRREVTQDGPVDFFMTLLAYEFVLLCG